MPYTRIGAIDQMALEKGVTCDNPCVILTMDNVVQFLDALNISGKKGTDKLAELPKAFRPAEDTVFTCVYAGKDSNYEDVRVVVGADGHVSTDQASTLDGTLYLRGRCFNISSRYYNDELKNNFKQGTSNPY